MVRAQTSGQLNMYISEFPVLNNESEYETLILGMKAARQLCVKALLAKSDLQLAVNKVNGDYETRKLVMAQCLKTMKKEAEYFEEFILE